jgi:hypothetical protein
MVATGATFVEGGCNNTRSTLDGVGVNMPANGAATFRALYAPGHAQVFTTATMTLTAE